MTEIAITMLWPDAVCESSLACRTLQWNNQLFKQVIPTPTITHTSLQTRWATAKNNLHNENS
jgi:hypothetical protein